jgi:predicted transcriptional regulator
MEEIANQVNIDLSEVTKYVKKLGKLGLVRINDLPSASPKKY